MDATDLKLTQEIAADIRARVKQLDFKAIEKARKAKDDNGTFDVIISTEDTDRSGEIVKQSGWELTNYKNNPIVLWGHDYYSLPVGVCTETYLTEKNGVPALGARGVFLSGDINPFAQQVRKLYEFGIDKGEGVGCTTSVGFIPKEFDENARNTITKAELLEFSFVPIPANQGVGAARGRAFTADEVKGLGLDLDELRVKGVTFAEIADTEKKEAAAGDACEMDDGSPGVLTADPNDPDGPLVCLPQEQDKSAGAGADAKKALLKDVADEHDRHTGEVEKALDEYREKCGDMEGSAKSETSPEAMKDLRSALSDEHIMHRAKSIATFRGFGGGDEKAFDRTEHLKALRGEHDAYESKCMKALDTFEEKCTKSAEDQPSGSDEHFDALSDHLDKAQRAHKKAVTKIAKAMCKDAFGEEEGADEKTLEILKEYLAPHVPAQLLSAVSAKVGARISAATREKLAEVHDHLKAASAVVEALHGGLKNDDGEESGSDGKQLPTSAPEKKRSRRAESRGKDDLTDFLTGREIVREITTVAQRGLERMNKQAKQ